MSDGVLWAKGREAHSFLVLAVARSNSAMRCPCDGAGRGAKGLDTGNVFALRTPLSAESEEQLGGGRTNLAFAPASGQGGGCVSGMEYSE